MLTLNKLQVYFKLKLQVTKSRIRKLQQNLNLKPQKKGLYKLLNPKP